MSERIIKNLFEESTDRLFEDKIANGEFIPVEMSIDELLDIANLRGLRTRTLMRVTERRYGMYEVRSPEHFVDLYKRAGKQGNGEATWVPKEHMDHFIHLLIGSRA